MMCMDVHCEDGDKDLLVYGDQGVSTEEHDKATYGELTNTQSEEEEEIKYNMALCTNDSLLLEKKRRRLNENTPDENVHDVSQSDISINEYPTRNSFNNEVTTVHNKIKSQKAWTMEMLTNDGNTLMTTMNGLEQAREDLKKFLYARAIHSNHTIQFHMQQIM